MVGATGFEPATSWSRTKRSSQTEPRPVQKTYSVVTAGKTQTSSSDFPDSESGRSSQTEPRPEINRSLHYRKTGERQAKNWRLGMPTARQNARKPLVEVLAARMAIILARFQFQVTGLASDVYVANQPKVPLLRTQPTVAASGTFDTSRIPHLEYVPASHPHMLDLIAGKAHYLFQGHRVSSWAECFSSKPFYPVVGALPPSLMESRTRRGDAARHFRDPPISTALNKPLHDLSKSILLPFTVTSPSRPASHAYGVTSNFQSLRVRCLGRGRGMAAGDGLCGKARGFRGAPAQGRRPAGRLIRFVQCRQNTAPSEKYQAS